MKVVLKHATLADEHAAVIVAAPFTVVQDVLKSSVPDVAQRAAANGAAAHSRFALPAEQMAIRALENVPAEAIKADRTLQVGATKQTGNAQLFVWVGPASLATCRH